MPLRLLQAIYSRLPVVRELYALNRLVNQLLTQQRSSLSISRAHAELALKSADPRCAEPGSLLSHEYSVYSQNGEDGILHEIFRRIGTTNRVFVEIGAGSGLENCTAFLLTQGWSGYWLDGSAEFRQTLTTCSKAMRERICEHVGILTKENVGGTLKELGVPTEIDLLSIDIDHNTYYVWQGTERYRPRVAVIEYNAILPADVDWQVEYRPDVGWSRNHNFGASLKALEILGRGMGYSLVGCDFAGCNAFFVRDDLTGDRFAEPYTAEHHHQPFRPWISDGRYFAPSMLDG